ncbi:MAG: acyltransferase [Paracoccus sp. (in: a-proteobacteria)]|uniref:acyltransferase family protein n=1 Tax=Paracoccus sp. TaxID=267 RepID=UPI0026DF2D5A|nr:acyltransferase [Paracoccus sp. (in: a-proteobacteria)]MDO5613356.1 acyltransferase [Paracoccus sp. (in: a-proteobacteria)]
MRPTPDHQSFLETRHFASLDGLRFICIAAVLWHHSDLMRSVDAVLAKRGFTGVDFFFVISGFLITTLLLRERANTGTVSLRGFYWRRFLRIIPIYFLAVTAVAAYYILVKGQTQYLEILPFYYLFLSNYLPEHIPMLSITWSLSVEEQYYVVWPLLLVLTPWRWVPALLVVLIGVNIAGAMGTLAPFGIRAFELGPLFMQIGAVGYAPILMGSLAAVMLHSTRGFNLIAPVLGRRWMPLALFPAILLLLQFLPGNLTGWPNLLLHGTMTAALISIVVREDNILRPALTLAPIARVGQVSYGIYIYHLIALHVVNMIGLGQGMAQFLIYSALSYVLAELSFRTVEAYFQHLRHKQVGSVGRAPETV